MDVSLRPGPVFLTGLLLGVAGAMALGLHRPTAAELAAAAPTVATPPVIASPPAPVARAASDTDGAQRAEEHMRAAAEAFRAQEALAAISTPFAVALAQPPKPRVRRIVKEADTQAISTAVASGSPIAIAPSMTQQPFEPVAPMRSATSVMGGAPEGGDARQQPD
jgi:hypothetical protein